MTNSPIQPKESSVKIDTTTDVNLILLGRDIWKAKFKILSFVIVVALTAIHVAKLLPNTYKAEALLMPNTASGASQAGGLGQLGGLASLAGVKLGGGNNDKIELALSVLKSKKFLFSFIEENNLTVLLMAVDGWDRETETFSYKNKIYDSNKKIWIREVNPPFGPEPDLSEVYDVVLNENLTIEQDKDNEFVKVGFVHYSPILAKQLTDKLILKLNQTIKNREFEEAELNIQYLTRQIESTRLSGMRTMFYELIEEHQKTKMLAKVRKDYVFTTIDPAIVPLEKNGPNRKLIVLVSVFIAVFLGVASVILIHINRKIWSIDSRKQQ